MGTSDPVARPLGSPGGPQRAWCFERLVAIDRGLRLHLLDWNPGSQHVVILLHGFNEQAHVWDPIAAELAADFRVICVDLRGHGESDWARDGYYCRNFATDIVELAKSLSIDEFSLIGQSLGARVGLALAADNPVLVRRLILSDTGPEFAVPSVEPAAADRQAAAAIAFNSEGDAERFFAGRYATWQPQFRSGLVRGQLRRNWAGKLVARADPEMHWLRDMNAEEDAYLWRCVPQIEQPALIVWGRQSEFLNREIIDRLLATIPNGRLETVESGHHIPRERPDAFLGLCREFLG